MITDIIFQGGDTFFVLNLYSSGTVSGYSFYNEAVYGIIGGLETVTIF